MRVCVGDGRGGDGGVGDDPKNLGRLDPALVMFSGIVPHA